MAEFRAAAAAHLSKLVRLGSTSLAFFRVPDLVALRGRLQSAQSATIRALSGADIPIEQQVLAHPQFPAPMSERLMELAPEFLLPGLEQRLRQRDAGATEFARSSKPSWSA